MSNILEVLSEALGPDAHRVGDAVPARNRSDWSGMAPTRPLALLLPRTTDDVATALRICHAAGQRVVLQGGLTGLAGGGTPGPDEIAISLERMSGIEEIDTASATVTALAGTPLERVQTAAEGAGFSLGIDLGARGSCSIGGNVATNAGGVQVLRYGMTRANVRGLEVVLADGTVVRSLRKMLKNNAGYDWTQLFIGSEGTLGVVTRVMLALHPKRRGLRTAFCAGADFERALIALRRLQSELPGELIAFEAMWPDYVAHVRDACGLAPPFDPGAGIALIIEAATGSEDAADGRLDAVLMALLEEGIVTDAVIAKSGEERRRLWALREAPAEFPTRLPGLVAFDVSIPLDRLGPAVGQLRDALQGRWPGITALFYGHVADSNLHLIVHHPGLSPQPKDAIESLVYGTVTRYDGSVSAEHGIGRLKRPYLMASRSPEELQLMRTLKHALDPKGILNAGRVL